MNLKIFCATGHYSAQRCTIKPYDTGGSNAAADVHGVISFKLRARYVEIYSRMFAERILESTTTSREGALCFLSSIVNRDLPGKPLAPMSTASGMR